ncbi:MAG: hypothetical protein IJ890_05720 [Clostridia bacterium]|nr:hypothetical protein [Clostridia bacterium]
MKIYFKFYYLIEKYLRVLEELGYSLYKDTETEFIYRNSVGVEFIFTYRSMYQKGINILVYRIKKFDGNYVNVDHVIGEIENGCIGMSNLNEDSFKYYITDVLTQRLINETKKQKNELFELLTFHYVDIHRNKKLEVKIPKASIDYIEQSIFGGGWDIVLKSGRGIRVIETIEQIEKIYNGEFINERREDKDSKDT